MCHLLPRERKRIRHTMIKGLQSPLLLWLWWVILVAYPLSDKASVLVAGSLACNWGLRASHPLPPDIVVRMLKDNGFSKVKLFEADPRALQALGRSGIEVMLGIPNELLAPLALSVSAAEQYVMQNVSTFVSKYGVDIRYVAVGNEPFLKTYKGMFEKTTFPAMQNIQAALIKAGLGRQVKVTLPLNADVYQSPSGLPSGGDFRADIHDLMLSIVRFLRDSGSPLIVNIYPFLSLYSDPHFPVDYAFFNGGASPVVDGPLTYTNAFEANFDTLVWTLERNGFGDMPIIVGEIGWPTDGDPHATVNYARRFNQGIVNLVIQNKGTPKRPAMLPDIYLFALIDEDAKSIQPGNFERHWGIFYYDGTTKYPLVLSNGRNIVPAKGVKYLDRQWCVLAPEASIADPSIMQSVNYACTYADCTSLGYGSSCNGLDVRSNISYAFNEYYQTLNQQNGACNFNNLSVITTTDPSVQNCKFEIMIDIGKHELSANSGVLHRFRRPWTPMLAMAFLALSLWT